MLAQWAAASLARINIRVGPQTSLEGRTGVLGVFLRYGLPADSLQIQAVLPVSSLL